MRTLFMMVLLPMLQLGSEANAAWHVAKSRHFVIYADDTPRNLQEFATRLERFDQAVRHVAKLDDPPVGDGNRLTVFVLANEAAVQKMIGQKDVGGFYEMVHALIRMYKTKIQNNVFSGCI